MLKRLARSNDGTSAIEFAFVGPVAILLVVALIEMGFVLTGGIFLDIGARAASRFGITGAALPGQTREEAIRDIVTGYVCPSAIEGAASDLCFWTTDALDVGDGADGSPLQIATLAYTDPRNVGQPEPFSDLPPENGVYDAGEEYTDVNGNNRWDADMGASGAGGSGDVVIYTIRMPQRVGSVLLTGVLESDVFWHRAQVVVRNEPF